MKYGYTKETQSDFDVAIKKVTEALSKEGFGVLTKIDVKETFKKKLDVDFDNYVILGACNPMFAHASLQAEQEIGLLLPCNVLVYEKNDEIFVSSILPTVAMSIVENEDLQDLAKEVEKRLKKVIDSVE